MAPEEGPERVKAGAVEERVEPRREQPRRRDAVSDESGVRLVKKKHYNFLESLAEAVFNELFKDRRIGKIMLKIEKLEILKECSSVGIQITKKRSYEKF